MSKPALIRGFEVVIGIETHAQLSTQSKIFSGSSTAFGAAPNTQASPVDLALPGTLPVMNRGAVERAIRFGLAVGAKVAPLSIFARKNYFYPDLPKGYQISQYETPVVQGGTVEFFVGDKAHKVHLTRAHRQAKADGALDGAAVRDRQRAGQRQVHRRGLGVGRGAEGRRRAAEDLAVGRELRVRLDADDDLEAADEGGFAHGQ